MYGWGAQMAGKWTNTLKKKIILGNDEFYEKINQGIVIENWMFPLDWKVRKVLSIMLKDPSLLKVGMEAKRARLAPRDETRRV